MEVAGVVAAASHEAFDVDASIQHSGDGLGGELGVVVAAVDVVNGAAVRNDVAVEAPQVTEGSGQHSFVGTGGEAIDGVVGTHDAANGRLRDW